MLLDLCAQQVPSFFQPFNPTELMRSFGQKFLGSVQYAFRMQAESSGSDAWRLLIQFFITQDIQVRKDVIYIGEF